MSVLVTVVGPRGAADLELDDTRAVGELAGDVAAVLGEPAPAVLRTADGLQLPGSVTLAGAGVLDGDHLRLVPSAADARPSPDGEPPVLVCYLVLDTSDSMAGPALEAANAELARLWAAVRTDDRLADRCRLGVVTFDEEARLVAPLAAPSGLDRAPWFAATRPATNYEAAFRLLHRQLARDLAALRSAGRTPLRPLAVLVTDGRPTRGYWPPAHAALVDPAARDAADLVAFGFGDACEIALRRIGTAGAFLPAHAGGGRRPHPQACSPRSWRTSWRPSARPSSGPYRCLALLFVPSAPAGAACTTAPRGARRAPVSRPECLRPIAEPQGKWHQPGDAHREGTVRFSAPAGERGGEGVDDRGRIDPVRRHGDVGDLLVRLEPPLVHLLEVRAAQHGSSPVSTDARQHLGVGDLEVGHERGPQQGTGRRVLHGTAAQGHHARGSRLRLRRLDQFGDRGPLEPSEDRLALHREDLRDGAPRALRHDVVAVREAGPEPGRQ